VGTIVVVDLGLLGLVLRGRSIGAVSGRLAPWTRAGFAVMAVTGLLMFGANASRYAVNPAFLAKMALLLAAVAFHFTTHRDATFSNAHSTGWRAVLTAVASLMLWSAVVLAGRGIADFDVAQDSRLIPLIGFL